MADPTELIVVFKRGVAESAARAVVEGNGGSVRRKMRSDHADQVTLLVRIAADALSAAQRALAQDPSVEHSEVNLGGFRPM